MQHEIKESMMGSRLDQQVVKSVGASGQISLGKEFAGRQVLVETPEPGVWVIRTATVVPDNERWLHSPAVKQGLAEALEWAAKTPPKATDLSALKVSKKKNGARGQG
jgi:hypothetical protein